jgi:predicted RNA-binding protein associated with RNAse of E/G family
MAVPRPFEYRYVRPPGRVSVHQGTLLHESNDCLVVTHTVQPERQIIYRGRVVLAHGSSIVWFLFKDRSYDVGRFYLPDGSWTGFYIDVTEPVRWAGADADSLEPVVDLFLDVWITTDGEYDLLDEDELKEASTAGWVTDEQSVHAFRVRDQILAELDAGAFPPVQAAQWRGNISSG